MHEANNEKHKTYFNWSSGKDSAFALYKLLQDPGYSVEYLLTSVNGKHQRVGMHGLRVELLNKQLESIGINSGLIELPEPTPTSHQRSGMVL